jgi:methyl-accepting chemotaxis protein
MALPGGGCSYSGAAQLWGVVIMFAAIALMIWTWWLLAGWALSPLSDTAERARRLGPQNLGQRIGLTSADDQFEKLAGAIDDALDRLAAGYESQRRFAANASSSAIPADRCRPRRCPCCSSHSAASALTASPERRGRSRPRYCPLDRHRPPGEPAGHPPPGRRP